MVFQLISLNKGIYVVFQDWVYDCVITKQTQEISGSELYLLDTLAHETRTACCVVCRVVRQLCVLLTEPVSCLCFLLIDTLTHMGRCVTQ